MTDGGNAFYEAELQQQEPILTKNKIKNGIKLHLISVYNVQQ